jgi:hypothetical protein
MNDVEDILNGNVGVSLRGNSFFDISKTAVTPDHIRLLSPFLAMTVELENVNEGTAPHFLAKFSEGLNLASSLFASATYHHNKARTNLKKVRGLCALERFGEYVKAQKDLGVTVKETESIREAFIDTQDDVIAAANEANYYEAVREQLGGNKMSLTMALSAVKAIAYNTRPTDLLSGVAN